MLPCKLELACTPRVVNGTFQACAEGHEGALCSYCKSGYAMVTGACELCEGGSTAGRLIGACVGFVVLSGVVAWCLNRRWQKKEKEDEERHEEEEADGAQIRSAQSSAKLKFDKARALKPAFKSVYQYVQIVAMLDFSLDLKFPETFEDTTETFGFANLDVVNVLPFGCYVRANHHDRLLLYVSASA